MNGKIQDLIVFSLAAYIIAISCSLIPNPKIILS